MVEVIVAVLGGGLLTTLFFVNKKKSEQGLTIKSGKRKRGVSVSIEENKPVEQSALEQLARIIGEDRSKLPVKHKVKNLDMHRMKPLILSGSGDVELNVGVLKINGNYDSEFESKNIIEK